MKHPSLILRGRCLNKPSRFEMPLLWIHHDKNHQDTTQRMEQRYSSHHQPMTGDPSPPFKVSKINEDGNFNSEDKSEVDNGMLNQNSAKQKSKIQLKYLGPIEQVPKKRRGEGNVKKIGGDSSPLGN
ncbi:hypothetical protein MA16_Dca003033 [Dendrobium catenatum]|uniref:Uncharacterized protein n=1 Tax=Dendrobium catenatum TaxID=906689 RepID=A0A2I0X9G1_9ASPA|nr:hypothetical protein MA16_Dca003033 [Dendrobium catenatum]